MAKPAVYNPGAAVFNPDAVEGATVENELTKAAVAPAPGDVKPTGEIVSIVGPDGKTVGIDAAHLPRALEQGYHVETPAERGDRAFIEENRGLGGDFSVAAHDAVDAFTLGALDPALKALNPEAAANYAHRIELLKRDHTTAGALGTGFGTVASLGLGGGLFKGASEAGAGLKAAVLGSGEAGLGRKLVASSLGMAAEGGLIASPKATAEFIAGDYDKAGETMLYGLGTGAILGLPGPLAGAAKDKIVSGFGGIKEAVLGKVEESGANSLLEKLVGSKEENAFKSLSANQASLGKAFKSAEFVPGGVKAVGAEVAERGLLRRVGESEEEYAARFLAEKNKVGESVGAAYKALDEHAGGPSFTAGDITKRLRDDVLAPLQGKVGYEPIVNRVEGLIGSIENKYAGGLTFSDLNQIQRDIAPLMKYESGTGASPVIDALRDIRRQLKTDLTTAAKDMSPELADKLAKANASYSKLSAAYRAVEDAEFRAAKNRTTSLTDYMSGLGGAGVGSILGGPMGALGGLAAGAANNFGRHYGRALLSRAQYGLEEGGLFAATAGIDQTVAHTISQLDKIPDYLNAAAGGAKAAAEASWDNARFAAESPMAHGFLTAGPKGREAKLDAFKSLADQITEAAANPQLMHDRIAQLTNGIGAASPEIAHATAAKSAIALQYLAANLPKAPAVQNPFVKQQWRPSDSQLADFSRRLQTLQDPFSAMHKLQDKTLGKPEMETLQAVYPKLHAAMVQKITEYAASGQARPLPFSYRLKLSMLTGSPIDASMGHVAEYQAAYQAPDAGQDHGAAGSGSGMRPSGGKMKPPAAETSVQRISQR